MTTPNGQVSCTPPSSKAIVVSKGACLVEVGAPGIGQRRTHITNGCYRLHPVEWNIGEAAGALAAYCLDRRTSPRAVRHSPALLADFQQLLVSMGLQLRWPAEIQTKLR
jgi:hypothetical protein